MKMNTNSNTYIIIYSAILVVIVAFLLAFVYQALKPMQDANVALDVKKQILYEHPCCQSEGYGSLGRHQRLCGYRQG